MSARRRSSRPSGRTDRSGWRGDQGSVTVEFALTVPAVALVLGLAVAGVAVSSHSVRLADAAAVVARQSARGDGAGASGTIARLAPGAEVSQSSDGALLCVTLRRHVPLGPMPDVIPLESRSCAPVSGR